MRQLPDQTLHFGAIDRGRFLLEVLVQLVGDELLDCLLGPPCVIGADLADPVHQMLMEDLLEFLVLVRFVELPVFGNERKIGAGIAHAHDSALLRLDESDPTQPDSPEGAAATGTAEVSKSCAICRICFKYGSFGLLSSSERPSLAHSSSA